MKQFDESVEDEPLSPAAERLRRKMVLLLAVSIGFMLVAVMIVLGVIVYRLSADTAPAWNGEAIALDLPAGARIVETSLSGATILLRTEEPEGPFLTLRSAEDGTILRRFRLVSDGPAPRESPAEEAGGR